MNQQEYELQDLVRLHKAQGAAVRLHFLEHCFQHPFRWAVYRFREKWMPWTQPESPAMKDADKEYPGDEL